MQVCLGNNKQVQAEGKDMIKIKTKSRKEKFIHDVLYISGLAHNLISIGQLVQKGYLISFHDNKCVISSKNSDVPLMD